MATLFWEPYVDVPVVGNLRILNAKLVADVAVTMPQDDPVIFFQLLNQPRLDLIFFLL